MRTSKLAMRMGRGKPKKTHLDPVDDANVAGEEVDAEREPIPQSVLLPSMSEEQEQGGGREEAHPERMSSCVLTYHLSSFGFLTSVM
jgi:hypothetical protein